MEDKNIEKRICKKKKFDFKCKKENAINSLFEVEHFLCDLKKICNTMCLYKILKWLFFQCNYSSQIYYL